MAAFLCGIVELVPDTSLADVPDNRLSRTRGWLVDNVRLFSGSGDCGGNGIPDECEPDTDGDEFVDSCDACPAEPALTAPDEPTETTCADGIDNDCDGWTDQTDWHCSGECPYTCGDINGSGPVNLFDFASFALCFGAPSAVSQACTCSDLNLDGTVNLIDFATFTLVFNAPSTNSPPNCP